MPVRLLVVTVLAFAATTPSVVRAELQPVWDYQVDSEMFSAPTALLGVEEFGPAAVFTGKAGLVFALDAQGRRLWEFRTPDRVVAPAAVSDIDGDGRPEILAGDQSATLGCLGYGGSLRWQARLPAR